MCFEGETVPSVPKPSGALRACAPMITGSQQSTTSLLALTIHIYHSHRVIHEMPTNLIPSINVEKNYNGRHHTCVNTVNAVFDAHYLNKV